MAHLGGTRAAARTGVRLHTCELPAGTGRCVVSVRNNALTPITVISADIQGLRVGRGIRPFPARLRGLGTMPVEFHYPVANDRAEVGVVTSFELHYRSLGRDRVRIIELPAPILVAL